MVLVISGGGVGGFGGVGGDATGRTATDSEVLLPVDGMVTIVTVSQGLDKVDLLPGSHKATAHTTRMEDKHFDYLFLHARKLTTKTTAVSAETGTGWQQNRTEQKH